MDFLKFLFKACVLILGLLLIAGGGLVSLCGVLVHDGSVLLLGFLPLALGILGLVFVFRGKPTQDSGAGSPNSPENLP